MSEAVYVRGTFEAGALIRRQFRAFLDFQRIEYAEHKGWLDSIFVYRCTKNQHHELTRFAAQFDFDGAE